MSSCASCTSGSTSRVVTHAETISIYCSSVKSNSQSLTGWLMPGPVVVCYEEETGVQAAASKGTHCEPPPAAKNCQVITKPCIEHWHKHRCARTKTLPFPCALTLALSHAGRLAAFFSFHYNLCFG